MEKEAKIFVTGHRGLVGSSIVRALLRHGYRNIVTRTREELDLTNQAEVNKFFKNENIDYVFHAAGKVGGILYNKMFQADFLYENLIMATNVIKASADYGVTKLLYLGSSCIYPKQSPQPIKEEYLLSGELEPTNEGYAIAKIAGLKLCEKFHYQYGKSFISAMPTNLYGPNDNFHPEHSHVIPGMMRRFHQAKLENRDYVVVWGSGKPRREFLYIDDLAEGLVTIMLYYDEPETINIGTGKDVTIAHLAKLMKEIVGFKGEIRFDITKPDGTYRKQLDVSKVFKLGWRPIVDLKEGLRKTYKWACERSIFESKQPPLSIYSVEDKEIRDKFSLQDKEI